MPLEQSTASTAQPTFNLAVDSCCDLPRDYLESHGVAVAHFTYAEPGKPDGGFSGVDDLFVSRDAHEFYEAIRQGAMPMTSQPSPGEFERVFMPAIESGLPTLYLSFSSGLSGCYEGGVSALEMLRASGKADGADFRIMDTRQASSSLALLIYQAAEMRAAGASIDQVQQWAETAMLHDHILFMVDDLDCLARGGRIPAGAARVGAALGVRPMLSLGLDGKLTMAGVSRGRRKALRRLADFAVQTRARMTPEERAAWPEVVALGNADCPQDMEELQRMIAEQMPEATFVTSSIGTTIGCHVGPGMLVACVWGPRRGEERGSERDEQ